MEIEEKILMVIAIIIGIIAVFLVVHWIILTNQEENRRKKYRPRIEATLKDLFSRHNKLSIGMSEEEMLKIMDFRFDKMCEEDKTTYRYVFRTRGGSGSSYGSINTNFDGRISGSSSSYSEQHDEISVSVECIEGKVTKIIPYNMNELEIPLNYLSLKALANYYEINYED